MVTFYVLTDSFGGFLRDKRFVIMDRDTKYSDSFRTLLENSGTDPVRLPYRSPNLSASSERCVRSIQEECPGRMIFFGERSLRRAVSEYAAQYHEERNHQGLGNRLIEPEEFVGSDHGRVLCRDRLGGMLRYYHRSVA